MLLKSNNEPQSRLYFIFLALIGNAFFVEKSGLYPFREFLKAVLEEVIIRSTAHS